MIRGVRRRVVALVRDRRVRRVGAAVGRALFGLPEVPRPLLDPADAMRALPFGGALGDAIDVGRRARWRRRAAHAGDPTVSVVIAARDASGTLAASLESLLAQSYPALEVLVVDDASHDGTAEVARRLAARDRRVRVIERARPGGAAAARNTGLARARGDFVTFQDADDLSHPDRILRQLDVLLRNPDARLAMCRYRRVDPAGHTVVVNERAYRKCIVAMMFPRAVHDAVGFFREDLPVGEDAELYERIKVAFGEASERRLTAPLYEAAFDPASLLFGAGAVTRDARGHVVYRQAPEHAASQARWREEHRAMARGERPLYVPADDA